MKISNLHVYALTKLKVITTVFVVILILLSSSLVSYNKSFNEKDDLSNEITISKKNLDKLTSGVINAENAVKIWNNGLNLKYNQRQGIQIENAKKRLELIKSTFNITDLKVSLNTPQKVESISSLKYQDVMFSKLTLDFNAYTDADAIKFLDAVSRQLPGILLIQEIKLYAPNNIRTSLNQALSKGSIKDLQDTVKVSVTISWFDFIDKASQQSNSYRSIPGNLTNAMKSVQNVPTMQSQEQNK